ncbi:MAG: nucleotide exchange factor GrpE [Myxococcales bacterium]|nr:nucleotide exchange factor GrpE [Myxococcales bacterium]
MSEQQGEKPEDDDVIFPEEQPADGAEAEPTDLEKAHTERDRMREQLLRIAADFDNFRKRSRKEIDEVRKRTIEDTLREVLPIVDNLERAAEAMKGATEVSAVTEGVHMVLRGFEDIAARLGLKRVPTVGHQFDPTCHDAMQQEETNEHAPGTIIAEVVPGYYLGERLLRPAMVVVAKPPSAGATAKEDDGASQ